MFLVGVSKVDITPPVGISHSGWGAAVHEQAEGVDMPMYAYVLLIETESSVDKVVIVDVDLGGVPDGLDNRIRGAITKEVDIDPKNIRISATHTHAGPVWYEDHGGGDGSWVVGGKEYIEPYYDSIPIKIGEAAKSAANKKTKCHISHGIGRSDININRRPADEKGNLFTGRNWNGVVDHSVDIIGFDDASGNPIATIVGYACHPTILGPENRLLSPDYPGHSRKMVEEVVGGMCLFLQGAAGNQGPIHGFVGEVEVARKAGAILGLEASKIRMSIDPFERREKLVEILPSGADLGIYEDEIIVEPSDTLKVSNSFIELPSLDFPPFEETLEAFKKATAELEEVRKTNDPDLIKKTVSMVKRTNFKRNLSKIASGGKVNIWVQTIKIGDIILQGIPLEPFIEFGNKIKSLNPQTKIFFSGYTNGWLGYLPTANAYEEGGYEVGVTPLSPESESLMIDFCDTEIKKIT